MAALTLTATKGTFTETGIAAGLVHGRYLVAATGAMVINQESAGFGSFVSTAPRSVLSVQNSSGEHITSSGAIVDLDILEGAGFTRDIETQYEVTRMAMVTNLNADGTKNTAQIFQEAIDAVKEVIGGDLGSSCPDISTPTYLARFIPEMVCPRSVRVKIVYRGYPLPRYDFDASLSQIESNIDVNGDPIVLAYDYPANYPLDTQKAGKTVTQGGMVSVPQAEVTITISFIVARGLLPVMIIEDIPIYIQNTLSATEIMTALMLLEGHVNNAPTAVGNIMGGSRCWLVERVGGRSRDGGMTYEASITLHLRPQGWDPMATYINPDDGKPPADLLPDVGYYRPQVYKDCQFPGWLFTNPNIWVAGSNWSWQ